MCARQPREVENHVAPRNRRQKGQPQDAPGPAPTKKQYKPPGYDNSYAQQKRDAWNNYRAYFEPAMTKYRQNIFDAVLELSRADEKTVKKLIKKIVKLNEDYVSGCLDAMGQYLQTFTKVYTEETLDARGIDWNKMVKMAAKYDSEKKLPPKPKKIRSRKEAKALAKSKRGTTRTKRKRGAKK